MAGKRHTAEQIVGKLRKTEIFEGQAGTLRIRGRTAAYIEKYRDRNGVWIENATGCKDETAARAILGQLERRAELIRAGVMTPEEDDASRHGGVPIADHIEAWKEHFRLKGSTERWWTRRPRDDYKVMNSRAML